MGKHWPSMRYHADFPKGRVFKTPDDVIAAGPGWMEWGDFVAAQAAPPDEKPPAVVEARSESPAAPLAEASIVDEVSVGTEDVAPDAPVATEDPGQSGEGKKGKKGKKAQ